MRLLSVFLALALVSGCARVEKTTRIERGPMLRTFERPEVLEGELSVELQADWPTLKFQVTGNDICRTNAVEEYAEEHITERTSPAAGPAFSTGVANVLAAGVLAIVGTFVSNTPDTGTIDAAGRYGPSPRQQVQGWTVVTLAVGLPSLIVGVVAALQTGVDTETKRVEQVVSQKQAPCNRRAVSGPVQLIGYAHRLVAERTAVDGVASVEAGALDGPVLEVTAFGRPARISPPSQATLDAFNACVTVELAGAPAPESLSEDVLLQRAADLRTCREVRGDAVAGLIRTVDDTLNRRKGAEPLSPRPLLTFDEAMARYEPKLRLGADKKALAVLETPEKLSGQAVLLRGLLEGGVTADGAALVLGERTVFLSWDAAPAGLAAGTRVEVVAVVTGWHTLGGRPVPAMRVAAIRAAF